MSKKTIIYIAGYGKSGSTLLERILSSHEKIYGLGEFTHFLGKIDSKDSSCSCGKSIQECDFWSRVIQNFRDNFDNISELREIQSEIESFSKFPGYISGRRHHYGDFSQKLFNGIFRELPDGTDYVVDSSKTARSNFFRPIALSSLSCLNVKVIHLVRDGRGCLWSNLRKIQEDSKYYIIPKILRWTSSWSLANIAAHVFQLMVSPKRYCRIRYEDFVEKPEHAFAKLGDFLDIDFGKQVETIKSAKRIPLCHQIEGNRMRHKKETVVLKKDTEWKSRLGLLHKLVFVLLNWPLVLFYR